MKKLLIMLFALLLVNPLFSSHSFAADNGGEESSDNGGEESSDNGDAKPAGGGDEEPECD